MAGYAVLKPKTPYQTEEDCPMKFVNGEEFTIDEAVNDIICGGEQFKCPNVDLLYEALNNTPRRIA